LLTRFAKSKPEPQRSSGRQPGHDNPARQGALRTLPALQR
jgi:hypothetical protein